MDAFAGENLIYRFGDFEVESGQRILRSRLTGVVPLTPRAFDLLLLLVRRPNVLVTKDELIAALWPDTVVEENNLEQAVFTLRQALGERRGDYRYIKTIHRRGYQFTAKVEMVSAAAPAGESPPEPIANRSARRTAIIAGAGALALGIVLSIALLRDPGARPTATIAPPAADILAVRHLDSADDEASELLADTVTMVLEQRFSGIVGLPVIAPESVWSALHKEESATEFGQRMHARYVLGGEVARSGGERLHVAVALTDSGEGKVLWSRTFDRPASDFTAIRDEIVAHTTDAMHVAGAVTHSAVKSPIDLEACQLWMSGQRLIRAGATIADADKATVLFSRATVLDPHFASGYLGVATSLLYSRDQKPHFTDDMAADEQGVDKVLAALDRALELNPALGEAWVNKARLTEDAAEAERMFRHGLRLKPNYSVGSMLYYNFLMRRGRTGEAIDIIERARRLDPMSATLLFLQADALMTSRSDVEASDRLLRQALELEGGVGVAGPALAASLQHNHGQFADAIRLARRLQASADVRAMMAMMYLDMDDLAAADRVWLQADPTPTFMLMVNSQYRRDTRAAAEIARRMLKVGRESLYGLAAQSLRDEAVATGDFAAALRELEPAYATYLSHRTTVSLDHEFPIVFAHVLILSGQVERGRRLARELLVGLEGDSVGRPAHWFARERAELFAMLGEDDQAINELAADQEANHWTRWWYTGDIDPVFVRLRADPRFSALAERARAHRSAQRALLEDQTPGTSL